MDRYTKEKEDAIKIVIACAEKYRDQLLNRSLLFITKDKSNNFGTIEVFFKKRNYQHLTGLRSNKAKISANRFFDLCLDNRLGISDFEFAEDGTTELKLAILPYLMTKNLNANSVGDYNNTGVELYTEKLAGSVKGCVGFRIDPQTGLLLPNTVLNMDIRTCTKMPQSRILLTYRKKDEEQQYNEIVYSAKNIEWEKIRLPSEYSYLHLPETQ